MADLPTDLCAFCRSPSDRSADAFVTDLPELSHHLPEPMAVGEYLGLSLMQYEIREEALIADRLGQR